MTLGDPRIMGPLVVQPAPPELRVNWRAGARALRELIAEPEKTEKAEEITFAIGVRDEERRFQRFVKSEQGQRLLQTAPSLLAALSDRETLERLPNDSLGRAYLEYLDENGFEASSLVSLRHAVQARRELSGEAPALDPARAWFRDRVSLCHDLFHVLTGYGTDGVGEATLLAFSQAQQRGRAVTFLALGAGFEAWRSLGSPWLRYAREAWRRGRDAEHLLAQPWEELLPLPLRDVREATKVAAPSVAHPGGIWSGDRDEAGGIRLTRP